MCGSNSFLEVTAFRGQSLRFKNETFDYGRCKHCRSIVCLADIPDDVYDGYPVTDSSFALPIFRLARFFKKINVDIKSCILDFGCGSGVVLSALKKQGYLNIDGYEPFNKKFKDTIDKEQCYDFVYSTYVFEHLFDFDDFFDKLDKVMRPQSRVFILCDTGTRIPRLNPDCLYQRCSIHAPFHTVLPSDDAVIKMFLEKKYKLERLYPYDIQRSGFVLNNRVIALFLDCLGDTKDQLISATLKEQMVCLLKSPLRFFNAMFINTKDTLTTAFVFKKL